MQTISTHPLCVFFEIFCVSVVLHYQQETCGWAWCASRVWWSEQQQQDKLFSMSQCLSPGSMEQSMLMSKPMRCVQSNTGQVWAFPLKKQRDVVCHVQLLKFDHLLLHATNPIPLLEEQNYKSQEGKIKKEMIKTSWKLCHVQNRDNFPSMQKPHQNILFALGSCSNAHSQDKSFMLV